MSDVLKWLQNMANEEWEYEDGDYFLEAIKQFTRLRAENEKLREALDKCVNAMEFTDDYFDGPVAVIQDAKDAIRAALEGVTEPASPWRDIESAPRDGTYIDLWVNDERIPDARWNDCRRQWEVWDTGDYDRMEFIPIAGNPTHWIPLPEPPR